MHKLGFPSEIKKQTFLQTRLQATQQIPNIETGGRGDSMSSALQNVCFFISTRNGQNGSMTLFYLIASSCFLLSCCVLSYIMPTQQLGSRGFFKRMSSDHFRDATLAGKTDTLEASSFSALASMGSYLLASCLSGHLPLGILPPGVCLLMVAGLWVATCWVAAVRVAACWVVAAWVAAVWVVSDRLGSGWDGAGVC